MNVGQKVIVNNKTATIIDLKWNLVLVEFEDGSREWIDSKKC